MARPHCRVFDCFRCAPLALITLSPPGCPGPGTDEGGSEDTGTDTSTDTGTDTGGALVELQGDWKASAGAIIGVCGPRGIPYLEPLTSAPLVISGDHPYQFAFANGCVLDFTPTATGAVLEQASACTAELLLGELTLDVATASFGLRSDDEAELHAVLDASDSTGLACSLTLSGEFTRDAGPQPVEVIAELQAGDFIEGIERDAAGNTWIVSLGPSGAGLFRIDPLGARSLAAPFPPGTLGTIVIDADHRLFTTVFPAQDPSGPRAIAELVDGALLTRAELPADSLPNGITADLDGNLYVADSLGGRVFRRQPGASTAEVWAAGGLLAADPTIPGFPGPNGLQVFGGQLYVSNPSQLALMRIPIAEDGSAGAIKPVASGVGIDGFAIDVEGRIWGTTHPFNGIVLVRPDGTTRLMRDVDDGLWGPTDAVFGASSSDGGSLFVVTDGNIFGSLLPPPLSPASQLVPAQLLRIDTDSFGAPLPGP